MSLQGIIKAENNLNNSKHHHKVFDDKRVLKQLSNKLKKAASTARDINIKTHGSKKRKRSVTLNYQMQSSDNDYEYNVEIIKNSFGSFEFKCDCHKRFNLEEGTYSCYHVPTFLLLLMKSYIRQFMDDKAYKLSGTKPKIEDISEDDSASASAAGSSSASAAAAGSSTVQNINMDIKKTVEKSNDVQQLASLFGDMLKIISKK